MEREFKTLTLPISKSKVVIKEWITAGEDQEIQAVMYKAMKMQLKGKKEMDMQPIDGTAILDREKKSMEIVIESLNDSKENINKRLLDLRKEDYDFLKKEIMKIVDFQIAG